MTVRLMLLGPPGAGKGTQAARVAVLLGVPHISTGDIFRSNVREATELGREAKTYMDRGELVPDEVVNRMVADRLAQDDTAAGFVLDGYPRTVPQAEQLERLLARRSQDLDAVVRLDVPEDELVRRVQGRRDSEGRSDDTAEVMRNRLAEYRVKTAPLESFYAARGLLRDVAGVGDVDEVTERTLEALGVAGAGR